MSFIFITFRADVLDRDSDEDEWIEAEGDEEVNLNEEQAENEAEVRTIPSKLKATIRFGYDTSMKEYCTEHNTTFDEMIETIFTHTQAHYRHKSLGTIIEFEVRILLFKSKHD